MGINMSLLLIFGHVDIKLNLCTAKQVKKTNIVRNYVGFQYYPKRLIFVLIILAPSRFILRIRAVRQLYCHGFSRWS